ncbi:hypothetical protein C3L29_034355 [Pseudomonas sp. MWU12-2534b]|nr:hypothetical protein C3L29_034355 [Pseudomonas sp. MWU12-2534b]
MEGPATCKRIDQVKVRIEKVDGALTIVKLVKASCPERTPVHRPSARRAAAPAPRVSGGSGSGGCV